MTNNCFAVYRTYSLSRVGACDYIILSPWLWKQERKRQFNQSLSSMERHISKNDIKAKNSLDGSLDN